MKTIITRKTALNFCFNLLLLLPLATRAQNLGTTNLLEGNAAGTNSVVLVSIGAWTATANASWLHLSAANQSGAGSTNVVFTFDANPGATRAGTLTLAGLTLAVTQAGATYVAASPATTLVSSNAITPLNQPCGVAVDSTGNAFIADTWNNAIKEWNMASNSLTTLVASNAITPLDYPYGVAVDRAGNAFIADSSDKALKKWSVASQTLTTLATNLDYPYGVAVDVATNAYIADFGNSRIVEKPAASQSLTTLVASGLDYPYGVAVDAAGNVYIADTVNNAIKEWSAASHAVTTLVASGSITPYGVAVDGAGNVYIADTVNNAIEEWTAASQSVTTLLATNLYYPHGVAVDSAGNVYIADTYHDAIKELPHAFVDPTAKAETAVAGTDTLPVVLPATANLTGPFAPASDSTNWLTIAGATNGVVSFTFGNNLSPVSRTAHIALLGQTIAVTQAGAVYALGTNNLAEGNLGGSDSVALTTTPPGALWTATTNATWLHLSPPNQSGAGSATVVFSFDANLGPARTNTLTIAGQTLTVTQAGATFSLATNNLAEGNLGGSDSVALTTTPPGAPWTATTNATWLHLSAPNQSGTGSATVVFSFDANLGPARTNTLTIAGQTLTVTQAGATFSLATNNLAEGNLGGSDSVALTTTPPGAPWTATTNATWLHLSAPNQSGAGSATVVFSFDANLGPARTNTLTIAGQTLTVTQAGATFSLATNNLAEGNLAGSDSVALTTTPPGAPWTATTNATWLHLSPANQSGAGSATVVFSFDANLGPARTNTLTIAGQMLTVTQAGATFSLGTTNLLEGNTASSDSVALSTTPPGAPWTATPIAAWLHLSPANQSGAGSTNVVFTFDANSGGTRIGTLSIAGQTATVTQAGTNYIAANPVTTLVASNSTTPLSSPNGVAVDGSGNVYIADTGNGAIKEWSPASGTNTTLIGSGSTSYGFDGGIAVDGSGNVYAPDMGHSQILQWIAPHGPTNTLVTSVQSFGVAVDRAGNLFIADKTNNAIKEWVAASSNVTTLVSSGLNVPVDVAVDVADNVYIADQTNNAIKEWTAASGSVNTLVSGLSYPGGVAVDGSGNVYFADNGNNAIKKWTATSGGVATLATCAAGALGYGGVAVDGAGNVYFSDQINNAINEVPHAFVDPTAKTETAVAGTDTLPVVLPATANLTGPFAPASDSTNWLTLAGVANGVVSFAFTANPAATNRTAHIVLLGQAIPITQIGAPVTPPMLTASTFVTNGVFQFGFTNPPGASFTVWTSTNLALPLTNWVSLGSPTNNGSGQYQFTDTNGINGGSRYYRVSSP